MLLLKVGCCGYHFIVFLHSESEYVFSVFSVVGVSVTMEEAKEVHKTLRVAAGIFKHVEVCSGCWLMCFSLKKGPLCTVNFYSFFFQK